MKIVIVGGGTAGWLAALMIKKVHMKHDVSVIESSNIGIVGAGEGSTGFLTSILRNEMFDFGCNLFDFFKETGATVKYGIKHQDWSTVGEGYFAPLNGSPSSGSQLDMCYCVAGEMQSNINNMHLLGTSGIFMEKNVAPIDLRNMTFQPTHALHFDAHDVGKYFKKLVTKDSLVKHIDDEIVDVELNSKGEISSLRLKSGNILEGDFFVDASGFTRVLMKKLDAKWVSYRSNLPVNSAMPFLLDYNEGELPEPWTTAWAQSSGWMWQIPTLKRKGCGYVFCDDFITPEKAQEEIETTLGRKIQPIRVLKFDTGRQEQAWIKNCLSIGLSAAFAEPLEATSIHSTIVQLLTFVFEYLKPTLEDTTNPGSIKLYNKRTAALYDGFKEFLNVHYMGGREDSEFWRYIKTGATRTEFVGDIMQMCQTKCPTLQDFPSNGGHADWGLWSYILYGMNLIDPSVLAKELNSVEEVVNGQTIRDRANSVLSQFHSEYYSLADNCMRYDEFIKYMRGSQ